MKLVLLPGMDGTGLRFASLLALLPDWIVPQTVSYPPDSIRTYAELATELERALEDSGPYVLLAESYSTPIAVRIAAGSARNLRALVICAGFVTAPTGGPLRLLLYSLAPLLFRAGLSNVAIRVLLTGKEAPQALAKDVTAVVAAVAGNVLAQRLREVLACDERAALEQISIPILYIQAGRDRLVKNSSFATIQRIKPNTALVTIDGPHLILQTEPQKSAETIVKFIEGLG